MKIHWTDPSQPFLALDFETTNTNPKIARAVSASLILLNNENKEEILFDEIINPGEEALSTVEAEFAAEIHNLHKERVLSFGMRPLDAFLMLNELLFRMNEYPLVIYNVPYDWPLLLKEFERSKIKRVFVTPMFIDPLVLDRGLDKYRKGKRNLESVCHQYEIVLDDAHSSRADAIASARVAKKIMEKFTELKNLSLIELQEIQKRLFDQWKFQLNKYFEEKNIDKKVNGSWPGA